MIRLQNLSVIFLIFFFSLSFPAYSESQELLFTQVSNSEVIIYESEDSVFMEAVSFSEEANSEKRQTAESPYKFKAKELIAPVALIGVGSLGFTPWVKKHINRPVMKGLQGNGHKKTNVDYATMLLPAVAGYGMNLFGFHGLHDVVDATIIYATAYILVGASTLAVKHIVYSPRPNGENNMSFPSGHTAIAFCGAELLRREYWRVSPWIGVGGYLVATATGFLRLYNNAHWLTDVLAGAGIGILCAEAAYWLYPVITKAIFKKRYNKNIWLAPSVSTNHLGLAFSMDF